MLGSKLCFCACVFVVVCSFFLLKYHIKKRAISPVIPMSTATSLCFSSWRKQNTFPLTVYFKQLSLNAHEITDAVLQAMCLKKKTTIYLVRNDGCRSIEYAQKEMF